jgi:hypothetical protein
MGGARVGQTITSGNGQTRGGGPATVLDGHACSSFHGWNVVGATFVMALMSFGLGFYGVSVYVATLQRLLGWSASAVSAPVTVYYIAGALLTMVMADL